MDRLFVVQVVIVIEQQWLNTETYIVNRTKREYCIHNHLFAADAVRFFNGTPVHPLSPAETFLGTGVYALYIHPGRTWAERCNGIPKAESVIVSNIERHFQNIGGQL